jgi:hypothetical protein
MNKNLRLLYGSSVDLSGFSGVSFNSAKDTTNTKICQFLVYSNLLANKILPSPLASIEHVVCDFMLSKFTLGVASPRQLLKLCNRSLIEDLPPENAFFEESFCLDAGFLVRLFLRMPF